MELRLTVSILLLFADILPLAMITLEQVCLPMLVSKWLCLMFETKHSSILLLRILKKYLFKLISRDSRENLSKLSLYFCFGKMHVQSQQQTRGTSACVPSVVPGLLIFSWSFGDRLYCWLTGRFCPLGKK